MTCDAHTLAPNLADLAENFGVTGELGPIRLGMSKDDVSPHVPEATISDSGDHVWRLPGVRLHFDIASGMLVAICTDYFLALLDEPDGASSPWIVSSNLSLAQALSHLRQRPVRFEVLPGPPKWEIRLPWSLSLVFGHDDGESATLIGVPGAPGIG
jgi:hypothetical protein